MSKTTDPSAVTAEGLAASAQAASKGRGLPPVHLWNPPFCGDIDMRIAKDGTWFYMGTPIGRFELVKLFSSILKMEEGHYYLVTPVEKVGITVEDAPFVAVDFEQKTDADGASLTFETHVGDFVTADAEHPIFAHFNDAGEPAPYIHVRAGLNALIDRKSFYRLAEIGEYEEIDGTSWFGLTSRGSFFPIQLADELQV